MKDRVVLITGAKGGLGTAVTTAFLGTGARIVGVSRAIHDSDFPVPSFTAMAADLTSRAAASKLVSDVAARFQRIDALVHVMGGFAGGSRVEETDDATLDLMLDLNYRAAFYVIRAVLPLMRRQGSGRILAVASRQGVEPAANVGAYSASKAALVALVRTVALENRDAGICANTVLPATMDTPGNTATDRSPLVPPADVAALLVHLASDAGSQITGAAIPVYGRQL